MQPRSVYVHIPFCARKCYYCDFAAYTLKGQPVDDYLTALEIEMELALPSRSTAEVETIYIGGGTPTVLTERQMDRLLQIVNRFFPERSAHFEFTVEANPGTVNEAKLSLLRTAGVNRLSFGAQTFNDFLLRKIGRDHDAHAIFHSVTLARKAGFNNISLDLMFGLPEQTVRDVDETLSTAFALEVNHFSAYALKVEENTPFAVWQRQGTLALPSEDEEYEMYQLIRRRMAQAGYDQYEISNFSHTGFRSRHNTVYWLNEPYHAFGVGAHGYVDGYRYANTRSVKEYVNLLRAKRLPRTDQYRVSRTEDMENTMILGLRLQSGVTFSRFRERFGRDLLDVYGEQVKQLKQKGWIVCDSEGIRLTEKGLLWGNDVLSHFLFS